MHQLVGATALYGRYEPVSATPTVLGPLLNANQPGSLVAVGAVLSIALLVYERQTSMSRALWIVIGGGCIAVLLATLSRGALLALIVGVGVTLGVLIAQKLAPTGGRVRSKRKRLITTTLPIGVVVRCMLFVLIFTSANNVVGQLENTSLQEIHEPRSKYAAWQSAMTLVEESPWVGVGRGAIEPTFTRVHSASAFVTLPDRKLENGLGGPPLPEG